MNEFRASKLENGRKAKFHSWKIKENSKVSIDSVVFVYEYSNETTGQVHTERYKSNLNGIIVKHLSKFQKGDEISSETVLFTYEKCTHPIEVNDMCAVCGDDLRQGDSKKPTSLWPLHKAATVATDMPHSMSASASVSLVHTDPSLKVSKKIADEIATKDLVNLVNNRKLVLLVDLDHTLIHTTNGHVDPNLKDVFHYELQSKNIWYHTKFRPGCKHFIEEMSKIYELHIVTFGEKSYAHKIATLMDPERKHFHDRILSRNEINNPASKADNLKSLFPRGDLMVCIIDDREDVWNYAQNLICVQPYTYFRHTGDINDPKLFRNPGGRKRKLEDTAERPSPDSDEAKNNANTDSSPTADANNSLAEHRDLDDYLIHLERVLRLIHDDYYRIYEARVKSREQKKQVTRSINEVDENDLPDVKKIIPMIRLRVLEGCVITFSGVVPTGYVLKKQRCYLMARSLGAKVNEDLVLADSVKDSEVEAFEALLAESITTVTTDAADSIQTTMINQFNRHKYEYKFEDEESRSDSSGGDYLNRSSGDEDNGDEDGEESKSSSGSGGVGRPVETKRKKKKNNGRVTTHLVAAKYGTEKVYEAIKSKTPVKVVTPEWLINCNFRWERCDENDYKLTKDYEYRNCIFHHDYHLY